MINCDLQTGRLHDDCLEDIAGAKTFYFMKHNVLSYTKNLAGEIDTLGPATVYRFEQDEVHGLVIQEIVRGSDETQYLRQQADMTMFYISQEFITTINIIKMGLWAIFFLDYKNKIRLLGEFTPMTQQGGIDQSGKAAGDRLYSNLSFMGVTGAYAPFLEDYTDFPFDNFPGIIMVPRYDTAPGLLIYNDPGEHYKHRNFPNNRLDYKG
jgi:hypothetical protein